MLNHQVFCVSYLPNTYNLTVSLICRRNDAGFHGNRAVATQGAMRGRDRCPMPNSSCGTPCHPEHHQWNEPSPRVTPGDARGRSSGKVAEGRLPGRESFHQLKCAVVSVFRDPFTSPSNYFLSRNKQQKEKQRNELFFCHPV